MLKLDRPQANLDANREHRPVHPVHDHPALIHSVSWPGANLNARMCVSNGLLYLAEHNNNKVAIFSLANPSQPTWIAEFATGEHPRHIEVIGRFAFVCCGDADAIEVHDISNPALTSGTRVGLIPTGIKPKMFQIVGNEIYVACYSEARVEKHQFTLPPVGGEGFSSIKVAEVEVSRGPLCLAYNGTGLLAVCGRLTDRIELIGTATMILLSTESVGGEGHSTCAWVSKTQLLVTDTTHNRLYSCDCTNLKPIPTGYCDISPNPEQIEVVGKRCYIPSFTAENEAAYLDCIDLTHSQLPVRSTSVPLHVKGAGFTAYHLDDTSGYVYVSGHYAPHNLDVVKVPQGSTQARPSSLLLESLAAREAGVAKLDTGSQSFRYITTTAKAYIATPSDFVIRAGLGALIWLPDPATVPDGKVLVIENVSTNQSSRISSQHAGFRGVLHPKESVILAAQQFGGVYQWDRVAGIQDKTYARYTTQTSDYTATMDDDVIRVSSDAGVTITLPNPAQMLGKTLTIKNVHPSAPSTLANAYGGHTGPLLPGKAITIMAVECDGIVQWEAIGGF